MTRENLILSDGWRDGDGRALPLTIASFLFLSPLSFNDAMNDMNFHDWSDLNGREGSRCAVEWGLKPSNPWMSRSRK